jgi:hypothetical protein
MTRYLAIALLCIAPLAHGAMTDTSPTEKIKGFCDVWIDAQNDPPTVKDWSPEEIKNATHRTDFANRCQAYIHGASDEMIGKLAWLDDTHKRVVVGNWEDGVTIKQQILIFVDYVNQNPAALNKPANQTLRQSVEAAKLYTYTPAQ